MTEPFDCVIAGGRGVTTRGSFDGDVAIAGKTVAALGRGLGAGRREIDAAGKIVLPGGVDSHCHIEQMTAAGIINTDSFENTITSAAFGGTTTVIPFAAQHVGMSLESAFVEHHVLARRGAVVDYALHMIVVDPTPETVRTDISELVAAGHGSIKVVMTYDRLKVGDEPFLDVLPAARKVGALVCVRAENHGMLARMGKRLVERGYAAPKCHALGHARLAEIEAFGQLIALAQLVDQPVMIFHVSSAQGAAIIRRARGEGVKLFAETGSHYRLRMPRCSTSSAARARNSCAAHRCANPRTAGRFGGRSRAAISTRCPRIVRRSGTTEGQAARRGGGQLRQIPNGMSGLKVRLPLLFDAAVLQERLGVEKFVELTATAPATIYNLHPRKSAITPSADADIAIWDPERAVMLADATVHDASGYSRYPRWTIREWPETVMLRGQVIVERGRRAVEPGFGRSVPRGGGEVARPAERLSAELDPARNGDAVLL